MTDGNQPPTRLVQACRVLRRSYLNREEKLLWNYFSQLRSLAQAVWGGDRVANLDVGEG